MFLFSTVSITRDRTIGSRSSATIQQKQWGAAFSRGPALSILAYFSGALEQFQDHPRHLEMDRGPFGRFRRSCSATRYWRWSLTKITRRTSAGWAKNGITLVQLLLQERGDHRMFRVQLAANSSSLCSASVSCRRRVNRLRIAGPASYALSSLRNSTVPRRFALYSTLPSAETPLRSLPETPSARLHTR